MASFFDRFKDLDKLKERAEALYQAGAKETRRAAEQIRLRLRIAELERRMNAEFQVLGEKVWDLRERGALHPENMTGAFDLLEALAHDIEAAQRDIEALEKTPPEPAEAAAPETPDDGEPSAFPPDEDDEPERRLEP